MSIKTMKNCRVVSGPLVLFLLITATMVLQHTGATCDDEWDACVDDAVCFSCAFEFGQSDTSFEPYSECIDNYPDIDDGVAGIDWCFHLAAGECCKDSVNPNDCQGNSAFVDYTLCNLNSFVIDKGWEECTTLTCYDGGVAVLDDDDAGVVDEDASVADDDVVDRDPSIADDDAGVADDTSGTSRVGSWSTNIVLTAVRGLAFLSLAPFLAASL